MTEQTEDVVVKDEKPADETVGISQEKLNSLLAEARRKGQEQGKAAFLSDLGLESGSDLAEVKSLLQEAAAQQEARQTELEKASTRADKLEKQLAAMQEAHQAELVKAQNTLKQAAVMAAATQLKDFQVLPEALNDVWTFIQGSPEYMAAIEVDESNKIVGADKAVLALLKDKPYLAKKISTSGPGTDTESKRPAAEKPAPEPDRPMVRF